MNSRPTKTPAERIQERRQEMPPAYRRAYDKAMSGGSRDAAIRSMCWHCMGWEESPADCTSPNCSLFPYRPAGRPKSSPVLTPEERDAVGKRLNVGKKHTMEGESGVAAASVGNYAPGLFAEPVPVRDKAEEE